MTIHYFPLQVSPHRYTGYLDESIVKRLDAADVKYVRYHPTLFEASKPKPGQFFDAPESVAFRARQVEEFMGAYYDGLVTDGDMVFFSDLFMPGVYDVVWPLHLEGVDVRVRGLIHGGSMNTADLISGLRGAPLYESAVLSTVEYAFVGSNYMRECLLPYTLDEAAVVVTGFLLDEDLPYDEIRVDREPIVVFNGRHSPDKQPELFREVAAHFANDVEFVDCIGEGLSKREYYELLGKAKVVVSFALHETFGTAIQEAVAMGCIPVVPDQLCYREQFSLAYRYETPRQCVALVALALSGGLNVPATVDCSGCIERWFDLV